MDTIDYDTSKAPRVLIVLAYREGFMKGWRVASKEEPEPVTYATDNPHVDAMSDNALSWDLGYADGYSTGLNALAIISKRDISRNVP